MAVPAGGRDRQGAVARRARADHGRADGGALRARGAGAVRQIRRLTESGVAVLFITHRLDEVFEIADRVTVLRDGRSSRRGRRRRSPRASPSGRWSGATWTTSSRAIAQPPGDVVLRVDGLAREGAFSDVGFELARGRGARLRRPRRRRPHRRRARAVRHRAGRLRRGRARRRRLTTRSPRQALRAGIAYVSEDRRALGLSLPQSITANVTLATLRKYVTRLRLLDSKAEREVASRYREQAQHPHAVARHTGRAAVRRQPAEDDAREVAERAATRPHPRRADARHRRRGEGRGPRRSSTSSPRRAWRSS